MKVTKEYIKEYIDTHIYEEHDYMFAEATELGKYDICIQCDCRRYINSNEWVVEL